MKKVDNKFNIIKGRVDVENRITYYLSFDIETLRYLKIYFISSEKAIDNIFKQIPLTLSILIFFVNLILKDKTFEPIIQLFLDFSIVVAFLLLIYTISDVTKKHKNEQLDLEILDYCIGFKERNPEIVEYTDCLDKFRKATRR